MLAVCVRVNVGSRGRAVATGDGRDVGACKADTLNAVPAGVCRGSAHQWIGGGVRAWRTLP